jgi:DNA polymerase-3 subunit alpha
MKREHFAHLHVHSDMSILAGSATMRQYAEVAKARGHKGIAFTEYGSLRGISEFIGIARETGLRQVVGIEFYVCGNMRRRGLTPEDKEAIVQDLPRSKWKAAIESYEIQHGIHDRQLLTVWARTNQGLQNLYRLSSRSWNGGFYYKPRIDLDELIKLREGLMVGTGCPGSPIHGPARAGRRKRALAVADRLWEAFGPDNMWLEVMPHAIYEQAQANRFTMLLRKRWGKRARLLATQDAHYVEEGGHRYQQMIAQRDSPSITDSSAKHTSNERWTTPFNLWMM